MTKAKGLIISPKFTGYMFCLSKDSLGVFAEFYLETSFFIEIEVSK